VTRFLAVFDIDGTLVDSQAHICAAMDHCHDAAGLARLTRPEVLEIVGLSLREAFARLHPAVPEADRAVLVAGYKEAFGALRLSRGHAGASPLYPGVAAGLDRLAAAGHLIGAATGKSRRGLAAVFEAHDLARHFVTAQCADDHPSKPHPAMLEAALAEAGVTAGRAVMIGDTEYDIAMGRAAGMRTIGVAWGYHAPPRLTAAGADALAADFAALEGLVAEMAG
jgi:phosphoglycolate phosphatase